MIFFLKKYKSKKNKKALHTVFITFLEKTVAVSIPIKSISKGFMAGITKICK